MKVRAVTDVLKNVLPFDKWRHADPGSAITTHVRQEGVAAAQVRQARRHAVTADAAAGDLPFEQQRGTIVRASGTEVRRAAADLLVVARGDFGAPVQLN